nr:hypothetical protein CFP56_62670 [Quercus suber]POE57272.1 hypothetical protein CFP56_01921 [Quercus suber]
MAQLKYLLTSLITIATMQAFEAVQYSDQQGGFSSVPGGCAFIMRLKRLLMSLELDTATNRRNLPQKSFADSSNREYQQKRMCSE